MSASTNAREPNSIANSKIDRPPIVHHSHETESAVITGDGGSVTPGCKGNAHEMVAVVCHLEGLHPSKRLEQAAAKPRSLGTIHEVLQCHEAPIEPAQPVEHTFNTRQI